MATRDVERPIRVLFVEAPSLPYGSSQSLLTLMKSLDPCKFTPILACNKGNQLCQWAVEAGIDTVPLPLKKDGREKVLSKQLSSNSKRKRSGVIESFLIPVRCIRDLFVYREVIGLLRKVVNEKRVDIVHLNNQPSTNRFGYFSNVGRPIVQHVRDAPLTESRYIRFLFNKATCVFAISDFVKDDIGPKYKLDNVKKVYNPVGQAITRDNERRLYWRARWRAEGSAFVIGQLGRLIDWKGQYRAIEAFIEAQRDSLFAERAKLVLVGSSADQSEYESKCRELAMSARPGSIIFEPFTPDISGIFSAFDLAVHPINKPEGFGRVVLESMACGTPVLARALGAIAEIIENELSGLLYECPSDLPKLMRGIYSDSEKLSFLSENAVRRSMDFSSDKISNQVIGFYSEIVGR